MVSLKKKNATNTVNIDKVVYDKVLPHIMVHYGHIGKFFSMAGREKMERDLKKMETIDTGND